jgi:hypothetical protein
MSGRLQSRLRRSARNRCRLCRHRHRQWDGWITFRNAGRRRTRRNQQRKTGQREAGRRKTRRRNLAPLYRDNLRHNPRRHRIPRGQSARRSSVSPWQLLRRSIPRSRHAHTPVKTGSSVLGSRRVRRFRRARPTRRRCRETLRRRQQRSKPTPTRTRRRLRAAQRDRQRRDTTRYGFQHHAHGTRPRTNIRRLGGIPALQGPREPASARQPKNPAKGFQFKGIPLLPMKSEKDSKPSAGQSVTRTPGRL